MATLLDRALMPSSGVGLTAGVNYFGDVGQRQSMSLLRPPNNVAPAAPTLNAAEVQAPDTGWRINPPEPGFIDFGSYGGAGEGRAGEGAPATGSMSPDDAATLGLMGAGIGTLGMATQDPGLGMMGNTMSGVAAASQGQFGPIGATVGGLVGGPTGAALGSIGGQMASQGGPTAAGIAGTLGGAMFGAPGYALGSIGGQMASGTATPSSIGSTLGYATLGPALGPAAGAAGAMIGGGLFGMDSTMSPMGVPNPGYAGLFGTDLGTQLGQEAFANPSTPSGIGTSDGIGFGMGSFGDGSVGQADVGSSMGGAQGVSVGGSSGLGLSGPSGGFASSIGSGFSDFGGASAAGPGESDGGGGGGGGGKIVCTAMNEAYGFGSFRQAVWLRYSSARMTKAHEVGYHTLFLPLVDAAYKRTKWFSPLLRKVLENIARHRTADLRAELRGTKRDQLGRAYRMVLEPLCYVVGRIKGAR